MWLAGDQIEDLPVSGRNYLDLAQLEPGVQMQDAGVFDASKDGFSSISFQGQFGRAARIEWMVWTSPMRPSEPPRRTFRRARSRSSIFRNRCSISRPGLTSSGAVTSLPVPAATTSMVGLWSLPRNQGAADLPGSASPRFSGNSSAPMRGERSSKTSSSGSLDAEAQQAEP